MGQHYKEIAEIALKRREASIPKEYMLPKAILANLPRNLTTISKISGHFTSEELEIIETSGDEILLKIREKKWASLEVTKAFCKASIVAQQLVRTFRPNSSNMVELTYDADKLLD
jgi:amidase